MPDGLLGFAGERHFILLPAASEGVFWFQCIEDGSLVFLLVDPFPLFPSYLVDLPDERTPPPDAAMVLAIVTLPKTKDEICTMNLQAPLVLDLKQRTGHQEILADPAYGTRHPVDTERLLERVKRTT
jgi:flagellar assembly factor FliW